MSDTAVAEETQTYNYPITVMDNGPATKKVVVQIPEDRIKQKLEEQFKELRSQAALPGFRAGKAPANLIRKRFEKDVREQVTRTLISESYQQAVENNKLEVLGEPEFDDAANIKLPDAGPLNYSFNVEVQPSFEIPDLSSLTIKKPKIEIKDEHVQQALQNLREQQGTLLPVEDRGTQEGDVLTADVHVKLKGEEVLHHHDYQFRAKPSKLLAIQVDDLAKHLEGAKPGDKREFTIKAPETHPTEKIRNQDVQVDIQIKDVRELELAVIDQEFLESLGFEKEQELHDALREQMVERVTADVQAAMRDQVTAALLSQITMELPTKMSDRQEGRVVQRRAIDLLQRGVPQDQIAANIQTLRGGAKEEALRELKLFFILQKIAEDQKIEVTEGELNGNIANIAAQRGERPEKLKQSMANDNSLQNLYLRMRELKAIDTILEKAKIEEVEPEKKD